MFTSTTGAEGIEWALCVVHRALGELGFAAWRDALDAVFDSVDYHSGETFQCRLFHEIGLHPHREVYSIWLVEKCQGF